ncbi:hypothetical protein GALL_454590 [mine drainage metagenome]|uniref:Uncharacterized protein n=1 Tax=mine drainage metagenome TaxID=410659 RepID=A0A1J5PMY2_9ZZZZ
MAAGFPEGHIQDLRGDYFAVAVLEVQLTDVGDEFVVDDGALGMKEGRSRRLGVEGIQTQFLAKLPMVARLGFLQTLQVFVQFLLRVEGGAVDTAEHGVLLVALPVGSGNGQQFEGLQLGRVRDVGAAAEIIEIPLAVAGNALVFGNGGHDLHLQRLSHGLEAGDGLAPPENLMNDFHTLRHDPAHLRLDGREILGREWRRDEEIVVEAILDGGADPHAGMGVQALDRLRQKMGRGMADQIQALRILAGDDFNLSAIHKRCFKIAKMSILPDSQGCVQQTGANTQSQVGSRGALGHGPEGVVGKADRNGHGLL